MIRTKILLKYTDLHIPSESFEVAGNRDNYGHRGCGGPRGRRRGRGRCGGFRNRGDRHGDNGGGHREHGNRDFNARGLDYGNRGQDNGFQNVDYGNRNNRDFDRHGGLPRVDSAGVIIEVPTVLFLVL